MNITIQEAQETPSKMSQWGLHTIIQLSKDKERILKAVRHKQIIIHKGSSIRLSAYFSSEIGRPENSGLIYPKY